MCTAIPVGNWNWPGPSPASPHCARSVPSLANFCTRFPKNSVTYTLLSESMAMPFGLSNLTGMVTSRPQTATWTHPRSGAGVGTGDAVAVGSRVGSGAEVGAGVEAVVTGVGIGVIVGTGNTVTDGLGTEVGVGLEDPEQPARTTAVAMATHTTDNGCTSPP